MSRSDWFFLSLKLFFLLADLNFYIGREGEGEDILFLSVYDMYANMKYCSRDNANSLKDLLALQTIKMIPTYIIFSFFITTVLHYTLLFFLWEHLQTIGTNIRYYAIFRVYNIVFIIIFRHSSRDNCAKLRLSTYNIFLRFILYYKITYPSYYYYWKCNVSKHVIKLLTANAYHS